MSRIVVGVDGSVTAADALRWAVQEAALREATVEVWHAWYVPFMSPGAPPPDERPLEVAGRAVLDDAVAPYGGTVTTRLVRGVAASALLDASRDADLLVLGARGTGGFAGLRVGSVSEYVVAHASCPVVVVPVHS